MSDEAETHIGALFSRRYAERGAPHSDSARFRARLGAEIDRINFRKITVAAIILRELGIKVNSGGMAPRTVYYYHNFVAQIAIRDVLDCITIIHNNIASQNMIQDRKDFRDFVGRAMREENLRYRLDDKAGVHFYFDEEFEISRAATIDGLSEDKHRAAREAFEDSHRALLASDTLTAVRRSFDAVENVFKQRFGVARLGTSEIRSKLVPALSTIYHDRVHDAAVRLAASFSEWANAGHQFRHAPGISDPSPPSMDIAILMISEGAANLRWLAGLPDPLPPAS